MQHTAGSKVIYGLSRTKERSNCSGMAYDQPTWCEEPLTRVQHIVGVKCHAGAIRGQQQVKLHGSTLQPPKCDQGCFRAYAAIGALVNIIQQKTCITNNEHQDWHNGIEKEPLMFCQIQCSSDGQGCFRAYDAIGALVNIIQQACITNNERHDCHNGIAKEPAMFCQIAQMVKAALEHMLRL